MNIAVIGNIGHLNYLFEDLPKLPECQVVAAAAAGGFTAVVAMLKPIVPPVKMALSCEI